ncbi:transketolase TktA [Mollisia scopiformis]|uniref:transketolase n=1 Tax=Mollisia scopiformis TaxID=149040 RepID=A0A194XSE5_MOLSC|nr:transketolase TktA [Mollisia scopiformis]KUJ22652.1 transketolase TktA [Mollisia scopiformis]
MSYTETDLLSINTIRLLAIDAIAKSNSGHAGAPMGLAPLAHILFTRIMSFNPKNPKWINRDRFVLSNGHACMLQYALLHLSGYEVSMDDLKHFRSLDSKTPGHPEPHETPGVEVTTGPLGQGFANAVGLAIAGKHLAAEFNRPDFDIVNNYIYCIFGDGCAMEGIASEAASAAGHLQLNNLIAFYDDNHVTIDGDTNCAFREDVVMRFKAYGWHTEVVEDADRDLEGIEAAIRRCHKVSDKPCLISLRTTIGFGSKHQGTCSVHSGPLAADDVKAFKTNAGFDPEQSFIVPQEVEKVYQDRALEGSEKEKQWDKLFARYQQEHTEPGTDLTRRMADLLPDGWQKSLPTYSPKDKLIATRETSGLTLDSLQAVLPELMSGSADLTPSNNTRWPSAIDFQPPGLRLGKSNWSGRYVHYGVREHAMAAMMNGIAAYGCLIPSSGTFLNFMSYAAGAIRLSALSRMRVIYIATHDSIGLGQDGPTHQAVETLAHFRAIPNLMVWRPADGNETSAAYYVAMTSKQTPSMMVLSRQNLPQLENSIIEKAMRGGYVVAEVGESPAAITLVSTGSEVCICIDAALMLRDRHGVGSRVVSLPCWEMFDRQDKDYRLSVLLDGIPCLSVEVLSTYGWERYSHEQFGLNRFGASGAYKDVYKKFEFTPEGVVKRAMATIDYYKDAAPRSPVNRAFL